MKKVTIDGLAGFLLGSAIGAAVGFLTAPRAGDQTRSLLQDKGKQTLDVVIDRYEDKRDQAGELIREVNQELAGRAGKLKEAGKKVVDRERKVLKEAADEVQQAVSA